MGVQLEAGLLSGARPERALSSNYAKGLTMRHRSNLIATRMNRTHDVMIPADIFHVLADAGRILLNPKRQAEKVDATELTPEEKHTLAKARKKIERIRKEIIRLRTLTPEEARVAAKAGLIAEDQMWWWLEEQEKGKRKAESKSRAGRKKRC